MKRIPQTFIDDLLNRLDIVDIIDSRVKLKKTGKNYSACCPFHNEKTPSFTVSPDKQFYYCFGCGATGTALGFVMEHDRLGFIDAVENLARLAGVDVPREEESGAYPRRELNTLYSVLEQANTYYQLQLKENPKRKPAVSYLQQRGLSGQIAKAFGLGYAPPGWDNLLKKLALNDKDRDLLEEAGLIIRHEEENKCYDRFRHRIMFPILDMRGRTIGFGGRILEEKQPATINDSKPKSSGPKYLNSPETPVFFKGRELYGLYQAKQANRQLPYLLVVEGYMDVIALAQYGITTAVATLGTACGEDHLKLAFKSTNQIIFCFDGDNAGRKAARRALENCLPTMEDGRQIRFLFLPEGQDPDSLVRQIGAERFNEQLDLATPLENFFFDSLSEDLNPQTMEGKARLSKLAAPLLHRLPTGIFRELMFDMLAKRTGLNQDTLNELITPPEPTDNVQAAAEQPPLTPQENLSPGATPQKKNPTVQPKLWKQATGTSTTPTIKYTASKMATTLLLEHPELCAAIAETTLPDDTDDPDLQQLTRLINYLKAHPQSSFHCIIGYWGGVYGANEQQKLTELVTNQFLGNAKRAPQYNSAQELRDAIATIQRELKKHEQQQTLKHSNLLTMSAAEFAKLSPEEKLNIAKLLNTPSQ